MAFIMNILVIVRSISCKVTRIPGLRGLSPRSWDSAKPKLQEDYQREIISKVTGVISTGKV